MMNESEEKLKSRNHNSFNNSEKNMDTNYEVKSRVGKFYSIKWIFDYVCITNYFNL